MHAPPRDIFPFSSQSLGKISFCIVLVLMEDARVVDVEVVMVPGEAMRTALNVSTSR